MSMTLKLDASALRALIEDDADFKLELQRAVTAEVVRNTLLKDAAPIADRLVPEAMSLAIEDSLMAEEFTKQLREKISKFTYFEDRQQFFPRNSAAVLTSDAKARVKAAVEKVGQEYLAQQAEELKGYIKEKFEAREAQIGAELDRQLRRHMDNYFEREVAEEVTRRLQAAAGA